MADDTSATYPDDCVYNTHHRLEASRGRWARLVKEPRLKGIVTLVDNKPPKPSKPRKPAKDKVAAPSKSSKKAAPKKSEAAPAKPVKKASKKVESAPVVEAVAPSKPVKKASKSRGKGAVAPKPLVEYDMEEYDNVAYVGITDYLADELGGIDSIDVPLEGDELEMDSLVIHIHVRNRIRHFRCPLTGRVLAVNQDVLDDPALIYLDWHEAWLFKMEYDDPDETSQLMNGQQYTRYLDSL